jgi:glycosyltransferase involved in cell wall biosynthesis
MISVIIPAHNEEGVIARALTALTARDTSHGEFDIVVVCNGCNDGTAAIARGYGAAVRVIETPKAGKSHALNLGDAAARSFPRIYIDADIVIAPTDVSALAKRLDDGALAVAPLPRFDFSGCSWAVRAFYAIRARMPSAREGFGGSGVYALSEKGRSRFREFPCVVADDGFIRIQFAPAERETLPDVNSLVFPPRRIGDLINTRTRAYYGNFELAALYPELHRKSRRNEQALLSLLAHPSLWAKLAMYLAVNAIARARARSRLRTQHAVWERDDTSRPAAIGSGKP